MIFVKCPFCGYEAKISYRDLMEINVNAVEMGYDPELQDPAGLTYYVWPCEQHRDLFLKTIQRLKKAQEKAVREYKNRIKAVEKDYFKIARSYLRNFLLSLHAGEGLIFWVSNGREEICVAYIREKDGRLRKILGEETPVKISVENGESLSSRYVDELENLLSTHSDISWKAVIAGLYFSDNNSINNIIAGLGDVFIEHPEYSLLDAIRGLDFNNIYVKTAYELAGEIPELYFILEKENIFSPNRPVFLRELARSIEEKYGVPIKGKIRAEHLIRYIEEHGLRAEREDVDVPIG